MKLSTNSSKLQKKALSPSSILKDIFVVIICICGIGGSLFFFYKAINRSLQNTDSESVATITFKYRTAQRRFENRLVWEWLQNNAEIYNGDHIRTGGLSEAVLHFEDETVITLDEKTLIQVKADEEKSLLPVFMRREKKPAEKKAGQTAQSAKTVQQKSEKTVAKSEAKADSKPQVTVTSGAIKLDTVASSAESNVSIIAGNHKINAGQNTQAVLTVKDDVVEVQTVTGEVAIEKLPDETQTQAEQADKENEESKSIIITEGNKASIDKSSSNVTVTTIKITEPVNNAYYLLAEEDKADIGFNYSADAEEINDSIEAMLEISPKEDFSELYTYLNLNVSGSDIHNVQLPAGRWSWRLHQKNEEGALTDSANGVFTVYKVNRPEIFLPEENAVYTAEYAEASSETENQNPAAKVMLSWKNDRRAIKYLVNAECRQNNQKISFYSEVSTCMTEIPYFMPATGNQEVAQEWTWTVTPLFMESWKGETIASNPAVFYILPPKKAVQETVPQTEEVEAESVSEEDDELTDELLDDTENDEIVEQAEEEKTEEVEEKALVLPIKEAEKIQSQKESPKTQEQKKPELSEKSQEPEKTSANESESEIKFEEEIFVSSSTETTAVAAPEFKVTVADEDDVETMIKEKNVLATEFSEKSRWKTQTDKSVGGTSTASCEQIIVDYDGKTYSGIKFESQINASTAKKLSSTLSMKGIQLPDSLQGSKGIVLKVIGDGNDYTLRIGVGNIEYGCKLKTTEGEVLLFDIPYKLFRQQTGTELVPLDPDEITGITLSPSVPFPGKYEITIFDMNAK